MTQIPTRQEPPRPVKRFVIHIGPHKTGSTYVQQMLVVHADAMEAHGIHVPLNWSLGAAQANHYRLYADIIKRDNAALTAKFDGMARSAARQILISSEDMSFLNVEDVAFLAEFLRGFEVEIIYVARGWSDTIRGNWQERVRHGSTASLPEYVAALLLHPWLDGTLNHCIKLDPYATIFGEQAISILVYPGAGSGRSLFDAISARLGFAVTAEPAVLSVHASPDVVVTELGRCLNRLAELGSGFSSRHPAALLADMPERPISAALASAMEKHRSALWLDEAERPFCDISASFKTVYGSRFIEQDMTELFFGPKRNPIPYIGSDFLLCGNFRDEILDLFESVTAENTARRMHK